MAEALQPLQRALRFQTQGNAPRPAASTPPQSRPATPQLNPPPRGAWQNQQPRNGQGFRGGNANQSGGTPRAFFQPQGRGGGKADHRHHRTHSGTNGSSSNVLPPRLHLIVHVVGVDAPCVVTDFVIQRFIGVMELCCQIIVAHRRSGTMNANVEPPLA